MGAFLEITCEGLKDLIDMGCAAAVYTQTTDVELELNGLMTYDRLEKADASAIRAINLEVIESQNNNWITNLRNK